MKTALLLFAVLTCPAAEPQTVHDKTLYALGLGVAADLAVFNLSPGELSYVIEGLKDGASGSVPKVRREDFSEQVGYLLKSRRDARARSYMKIIANEPGYTPFMDMLVKKVREGKGPKPKPEDKVKIHYQGTRMDGKVFESTIQKKAPVSFKLDTVIRCWRQGIANMQVGEKTILVCPGDSAYGDAGKPPMIGPGETLTFEIELLAIEK